MSDEEPVPLAPSTPFEAVRDQLAERVRLWVRWIGPGRIAAGIGAAVVVAAIGWWLLRTPALPTEAGLPQATHPADPSVPAAPQATSAGPPTTFGTVIVHVAGAVVSPGVYELAAGARVDDAIAAAGGAQGDADPDALNLAAPVHDGDRIGVPRVGETPAPVGQTAAAGDVAPAGPVDLNTATVDQLDALPGVGPTTAAAIVAHREANGPFATVDDLEAVRGIGPAKLDAIRELVTT